MERRPEMGDSRVPATGNRAHVDKSANAFRYETLQEDLPKLSAKKTHFPTFPGSALNLIRLPAMSLEEFANSSAQSGILTQQETIDIFLYFIASVKPQLCYPTKSRQGLKTQVITICASILN